MEFKWDQNKAAANEARRGISFDEASEAFFDPHAVFVPDDEHSWDEMRMKVIGVSSKRLLVVSYVEIVEDVIRIITAREAGKDEKRLYYEN
jgi:uncharacterized DUF497 family protein